MKTKEDRALKKTEQAARSAAKKVTKVAAQGDEANTSLSRSSDIASCASDLPKSKSVGSSHRRKANTSTRQRRAPLQIRSSAQRRASPPDPDMDKQLEVNRDVMAESRRHAHGQSVTPPETNFTQTSGGVRNSAIEAGGSGSRSTVEQAPSAAVRSFPAVSHASSIEDRTFPLSSPHLNSESRAGPTRSTFTINTRLAGSGFVSGVGLDGYRDFDTNAFIYEHLELDPATLGTFSSGGQMLDITETWRLASARRTSIMIARARRSIRRGLRRRRERRREGRSLIRLCDDERLKKGGELL